MDYYKTLGVEKTATDEEIKKAYRKLAKEHHPDANGGDDSKFKEVTEAYEILSDKQKRQNYDNFGNAGTGNNFRGYKDPFADFGFGGFPGFDDMFRQKPKKTQGSNISLQVNLEFEEAINGKEADIKVNRKESCDACNGTGSKNGNTATCPTCGGTGQIGRGGGFFQIHSTCPSCKGTGKVPIDPCDKCHGQKYVDKVRKIHIKIKPSEKNNDRVRLPKQGNQDGDVPGDILIHINVKEHEYFQRDGNNIMVDIPISYTQAVLGDEITIPTIKNKIKIKVPEGCESGRILRLKTLGINNGDMYVRLHIETPQNIVEEVKEKLEAIEKIMPSNKIPIPRKNK